jgi:hypothetical protein
MKNLKFLYIISLFFLSVSSQKLGLVHKTRELTVARGEDIRQVEILFPVAHNYEEFKSPFNSMKSYFNKIKDMPGLAESSDHYKTVGYLIKQISNDLNVLEVSLQVLSTYRDLDNDRALTGKCEVTWKTYRTSFLEEYNRILQELVKGLTTTWDATYFTANPDKLKEVKVALEKMAPVKAGIFVYCT